LGGIARSLGRRAFVVCGSRTLETNGVLDELAGSLTEARIAVESLGTISHEPEVGDVDWFTERLCDCHASDGDFVLAIGGGSAIDLGKAIAAMATNRAGTSVRDYLEGVGRGLRIENAPLPVLAMPTTAGTGSEATKNAVISGHDPPFKKSLRSDLMIPRVVLIDPELTVSLSPQTTAYTGMDAITQLIEAFISRRAKPIPSALALQGLKLAIPSVALAVRDGGNLTARVNMCHAALLSGMALANAGLGLAHGVAAALGVICNVPHGLACAVMLPAALRANREIALARIAEMGRRVLPEVSNAGDNGAADAFIERIDSIGNEIGIPRRLGELGVDASQVPQLVEASRGNSMSGNPRDISDQELRAILERML
jgi:alcohol dehydrogenase class IV